MFHKFKWLNSGAPAHISHVKEGFYHKRNCIVLIHGKKHEGISKSNWDLQADLRR